MKRKEFLFCITMNLMLTMIAVGAFSARPVRAAAPYLRFVIEYSMPSVIDHSPQGRLNVIVDISKVINDGSSTYDWYFYSNIPAGNQGMRVQSVPGHVSYGSNWETAQTYVKNTVVISTATLNDYDPTTTDGYTSSTAIASVTISETPGVTFGQSYTYTIPYTKVIDQSDYAVKRAYWIQDFNEQGDPGGSPSDSTYQARPAFVVRTNQNTWSLVDAWYKVDWGHVVWFWWEYAGYESPIKWLDAQMSGDT